MFTQVPYDITYGWSPKYNTNELICETEGTSQGSSVGKESICNAGDPGLIPGSGRSSGERIVYPLQYSWTSLVAQMPACGRPGFSLWAGKIPWRRAWQPLFLPRESPWTEEPGRLQSIVSQRVRLDWEQHRGVINNKKAPSLQLQQAEV